MLQLGGIEAWISMEGKDLPEYVPDISDDGETASCWIPSEPGKAFAIHWRDTRVPRQATLGQITIDGTPLGEGTVILPSQGPFASTSNRADKNKTWISPDETSSFVFSTLETTDDDTHNSSGYAQLGEILLRVSPIDVLGRDYVWDSYSSLSQDKVHERSKKAGAHRVQLGEKVRSAGSRKGVSTRSRPGSKVNFIFRYRPLGLLQAQEIAPLPSSSRKRDASADPDLSREDSSEIEIKNELDQDDEIQRLEEQLRGLREKRRASKRVKVESISHVGVFKQGEVIEIDD